MQFSPSIAAHIIFAIMTLAVPLSSFAGFKSSSVAIYTGASFPYSDAISYSSSGGQANVDVSGIMGPGISAGMKYIVDDEFYYISPGVEYTHLESDKRPLVIGNSVVNGTVKADIYNVYLELGVRYEVNDVFTPRVFVGADCYVNKLTSRPEGLKADGLTEGAHAGIGADYFINRNVAIIFENKWSYSSNVNMTANGYNSTAYKWNPGKMTTIIGLKLSY